MTKEQEQKLRSFLGPDTRDIISIEGDDVTFIKEQTVNVHSGANFFNGSQPRHKKHRYEPITDLPDKEDEPDEQNVIERIQNGVRAVYDSGLIEYDYEYAAVYKCIEEVKPFDKFSPKEFIAILSDTGCFSEEDIPSSSNIGKVQIKGNYPNWRVLDKGYTITKHLLDVGKVFLKAYRED